MHWLTKHSPTKNGLYGRKFVVSMLGVIGICCSLSALADPLQESGVDADISALTDGLLDSHTKAITDADLSFISGKGGVLEKIDDGNRLAVILWDEGGTIKRRTTNNTMDSSQNSIGSSSNNLQAVTLTVNRK
ncbi:hypothetical protein GALL_269300 [mine drainage metagenome]|uniref:Uncharacterized protein n=1 Tax=mine drainage metagenome TaxID=410659 RepID=A0A1J5RST5_9ZZZZ